MSVGEAGMVGRIENEGARGIILIIFFCVMK